MMIPRSLVPGVVLWVAAMALSTVFSASATGSSPRPVGAAGFSIADAIEAAEPGATIEVAPGEYNEQLVIEKPVTLQGTGMPVIDGGGRGDVIVVKAAGVTIRGFVIRHSGRVVSDESAGIRLLEDGATIEGNRLEDVMYGITVWDSGGHTIKDNRISSISEYPVERRGHAIYMYNSTDNLIAGNTISAVRDGFFLGFTKNTHIESNIVTDARYGIHYMYSEDNTFKSNVFKHNIAGGALMFSERIIFEQNEFSDNTSVASGYGLLFKDVDDITMVDNWIYGNRIGLTMEGTPHTPGGFVNIEHNFISFNQIAVEMTSTTAVTFTENTFIGNLHLVESRGDIISSKNRWSANGRGNFWDGYRGYDANGDGVGDIEYRYEGAYDDLVRENDALRAYSYTPARTALDMAAEWFPVYRPEPRVVDDHPLMSPPMKLAASQSTSGRLVVAIVMAALVAVPLAVFRVAATRGTRKWRAC